MKRNKFIAWLLVVVSMVMLTASVMPHHHHQDTLCMHSSVNVCNCTCDNAGHAPEDMQCNHGHQDCDSDCVTNFQTVSPEDADVDMAECTSCSFFCSLVDILSASLPSPDVKAEYIPVYSEQLHVACQPHVMGLRAPPSVGA